jgi:asparagine synthase (glutamine-hydrolysing)
LGSEDAIKNALTDSAMKYYNKPLLLSGGLDSSILCSIIKPKISVVVSLGQNSDDLKYARHIAKKYSKSHIEHVVKIHEVEEIINNSIRILKTFDPIEVRNSSVIYAGIRELKKYGYDEVVTGDGSDELFAGYNYLRNYYNNSALLQNKLLELWDLMHFSSKTIGSNFGVKVWMPYLDEPFITYAKSINIHEKVGERRAKKFGKFILRKAFEKELGRVVWRKKMALELGSNFNSIPDLISSINEVNSSEEFNGIYTRDKVILNNREHLHYYKIYRSHYEAPFQEPCSFKRCVQCNSCLKSSRYCHTCGHFLVM